MPIVDGTTYHDSTPPDVIRILESHRVARSARLVVEYGDAATGKAWGDRETGYIGRSTGDVKIPLIVHNSRSLGGAALLDHAVVRITTAQGGHELWRHPEYAAA